MGRPDECLEQKLVIIRNPQRSDSEELRASVTPAAGEVAKQNYIHISAALARPCAAPKVCGRTDSLQVKWYFRQTLQ